MGGMSDLKDKILISMFNSILAGSYIPIDGVDVALLFGSDKRIKAMDLSRSEIIFEFKSTGSVCTDAGIVWRILDGMGYC